MLVAIFIISQPGFLAFNINFDELGVHIVVAPAAATNTTNERVQETMFVFQRVYALRVALQQRLRRAKSKNNLMFERVEISNKNCTWSGHVRVRVYPNARAQPHIGTTND